MEILNHTGFILFFAALAVSAAPTRELVTKSINLGEDESLVTKSINLGEDKSLVTKSINLGEDRSLVIKNINLEEDRSGNSKDADVVLVWLPWESCDNACTEYNLTCNFAFYETFSHHEGIEFLINMTHLNWNVKSTVTECNHESIDEDESILRNNDQPYYNLAKNCVYGFGAEPKDVAQRCKHVDELKKIQLFCFCRITNPDLYTPSDKVFHLPFVSRANTSKPRINNKVTFTATTMPASEVSHEMAYASQSTTSPDTLSKPSEELPETSTMASTTTTATASFTVPSKQFLEMSTSSSRASSATSAEAQINESSETSTTTAHNLSIETSRTTTAKSLSKWTLPESSETILKTSSDVLPKILSTTSLTASTEASSEISDASPVASSKLSSTSSLTASSEAAANTSLETSSTTPSVLSNDTALITKPEVFSESTEASSTTSPTISTEIANTTNSTVEDARQERIKKYVASKMRPLIISIAILVAIELVLLGLVFRERGISNALDKEEEAAKNKKKSMRPKINSKVRTISSKAPKKSHADHRKAKRPSTSKRKGGTTPRASAGKQVRKSKT